MLADQRRLGQALYWRGFEIGSRHPGQADALGRGQDRADQVATQAAQVLAVRHRAGRGAAAVRLLEIGELDLHRHRAASLAVDVDAFEQLELASLPSGRPGPHDQIAPSTLKLVGSELHQRVAELAMEIAGDAAAAAAALGASYVAGELPGA